MGSVSNFIEKYSDGLLSCNSVSDEIISKCSGNVPDELISIWKEHGFCGYEQGLYWTINPLLYKDKISRVLASDYDVWPIIRTAFADVIIVYKNYAGKFFFDVINLKHQELGTVTSLGTEDFITNYLMSPGMVEGAANIDLFDDAFDELGELGADLCYGFEPLLSLGGDEDINNIKIFNFDVHLELLIQALEEPMEL